MLFLRRLHIAEKIISPIQSSMMQFVIWIYFWRIYRSEFIGLVVFYFNLDNDYGTILGNVIRLYCMEYYEIECYLVFISEVSLRNEYDINAVIRKCFNSIYWVHWLLDCHFYFTIYYVNFANKVVTMFNTELIFFIISFVNYFSSKRLSLFWLAWLWSMTLSS